MAPTINYVAVLAATVASMVIGFLWYGPLFGKPWRRLMNVTESDVSNGMKRSMTKTYTLMTIGSFVMAFVFQHSFIFAMAYLSVSGMTAVINGAIWNWLGFIAPVTLGSVLWEGKPWKLWFINSGYYLATFFAMSLIYVYWM